MSAPPTDLEQAWQDGLVDRWGHTTRSAVGATSGTDIDHRLWMAHNRVLIQFVDEERADFERMILSSASRTALEGLRYGAGDIIEIGSLAWLVDTRRVDIGKEHRLRLQAFRDLRNNLAHHKPIEDDLLKRIVDHIGF